MGDFSNKEKSTMGSAGYKPTGDPDVWKKDTHTITRREETTIFKTDSHTKNGAGISSTLFGKKAN